jgi:hypothetical protein
MQTHTEIPSRQLIENSPERVIDGKKMKKCGRNSRWKWEVRNREKK